MVSATFVVSQQRRTQPAGRPRSSYTLKQLIRPVLSSWFCTVVMMCLHKKKPNIKFHWTHTHLRAPQLPRRESRFVQLTSITFKQSHVVRYIHKRGSFMYLVSCQPLTCISYVQSYVSNIWHCAPPYSSLFIAYKTCYDGKRWKSKQVKW